MSNRDNYPDEDYDYRKIQKSSNKRRRRNDRHRNRQDLNDIITKVNNGYDIDNLDDEEDHG